MNTSFLHLSLKRITLSFFIAIYLFQLPTTEVHADDWVDPTHYITFLSDGTPTVKPFQARNSRDIALELGEWSRTFFLQIDSAESIPWKDATFEMKIEKSLTLMGEGPHIDLTQFKRLSTGWLPMQRVNHSVWKAVEISEDQFQGDNAPPIDEIKKEVKKLLGDGDSGHQYWLDKADECVPPFQGSCNWGESYLMIRLVKIERGKRVVGPFATFSIPLGC